MNNPLEPKEVAYVVSGLAERIVDIRPGAEQVVRSTDLLAPADGRSHVTETSGGLNILQFEG